MSWSKTFEEINKSKHDSDSFDCGENKLNVFIKTQAVKHMLVGISRAVFLPATPVLPNQKYLIYAFYSVAPNSISRETLPVQLSKKLPHYPIPVFLLAQLASHKESQGCGLGKISLEYLWNVNTHMHVYAIVVDCLTDSAEYLCDHNGSLVCFYRSKQWGNCLVDVPAGAGSCKTSI